MTQVDDLIRSLVAFEQSSTMAIVVEMSQSSWLVAGVVPGLDRRPLKKRLLLISAFATALLTLLGTAGERLGMDPAC
jgi:hypothetical protein